MSEARKQSRTQPGARGGGEARRHAHDIRDIVRGLASRIEVLAAELLPQGRRDGHEWRAGSVHGDPGQSLGVHLTGQKAGVWKDFAGGEGGDALDLVAHCLFGGDKSQAVKWSLRWLVWKSGGGRASTARRTPPPPPANPEAEAAQAEETRRKAVGLWLHGRPIIGTPVEDYLAGRGIRVQALGKAPGALRFHPEVWCQEAGAKLPAMLAAIQREGVHVATHRTWLARRADGSWGKAQLRAAKKVYGSYRGGFIPLWRGGSGLPVSRHPEGQVVAIAEGIEDALTVGLLQPKWRVLAAVSISNMGALVLPASCIDVVLCFDRDGANPTAEQARRRAIRELLEQGRSVRGVMPDAPHKDFNAWLQAETARERAA